MTLVGKRDRGPDAGNAERDQERDPKLHHKLPSERQEIRPSQALIGATGADGRSLDR
jgi:hypothetical protein